MPLNRELKRVVDHIDAIEKEAVRETYLASSLAEMRAIRGKYVGRSGQLTAVTAWFHSMSYSLKRPVSERFNEAKRSLEDMWIRRSHHLE